MAEKEKGCWFTTKTGVHVFVKDGQTAEEAIEERFGKVGSSTNENPAPSSDDKAVSSELESLLGKEFKGVKGQAAIEKLMKERRGYVKGAFHRKDIGDIDLLWGNDSLGLQHIITQRTKQGIDVNDFLSDLSEVMENGIFKRKSDRGNFEFWLDGKMAVIAPEYHGDTITYLLTAFKTRQKK